ncbi:ATP-binding protein [Silvibacterium dinghuense]|uniref:DNA polymerase III subunit delta n=1 Tax=Silvibacterium dinghuense TaxID=1560006 RepID=A0A4Q1SG08_9BACT|nr:DNA polymerase III subunit delta' [Silvibacterium dinghuense]RXS96488.1 DNA polymerase III subunit delta' [Silvibacterium dinghuense]GGG91186.1 DNA polymerase III subunit delta' [Silvibacterium dinghuense]
MGFGDFLGNATTVRHLREAIAAGRLPNAMILSGPRGAGKYTLAVMLAQAVNCLEQPVTDGLPDFCGTCSNCTRIGQSADLDARIDEAIAAREELRETDKKETRILVQTHPDVLVIPPDPPQLLIKLGQVRTVIREIYRIPAQASRAVYIFTSASFMKEAANSLLKVLEEPPSYASIFLLAENVGDLLPTIRSRAGIFRLGALPLEEIETLLAARRSHWKPQQRALVARLAQGAVGQALGFDLEGYLASRNDALLLLRHGLKDPDFSALFKTTETYRAGAEGQEKTSGMLRALRSLLEDLLLIQSGALAMIRNIDLTPQLTEFAGQTTFSWIEFAERGIAQVESGMRRNLLRSLSLDSFATSLTPPA